MISEKEVRKILELHQELAKKTERWEKARHMAIVEVLVSILGK